MRHIVSFSGGKDSTAMLHWLLGKEWPVDEIVFMDTGWEFPQMLEHIDEVEEKVGREIVRLHPKKSFEHWMLHQPVIARKGPMKGKVHRIGHGWPSMLRRWCTRQKINALENYFKTLGECERYIGIAIDESHRAHKKKELYIKRYPLIERGNVALLGIHGEDSMISSPECRVSAVRFKG